MKKVIFFTGIILFTNAINCMYMNFEDQVETKADVEDHEGKQNHELALFKENQASIKNKVCEFLDENSIQSSKVLTEIIFEYKGLSEDEVSKLNRLLWQGVYNNDLGLIQEAAFLGANVNSFDSDRSNDMNTKHMTPIMLAVAGNRYSMVMLLVELGADVNAKWEDRYDIDLWAGLTGEGMLMKQLLNMIRNNQTLTEDMLSQISHVESQPEPVFHNLLLILPKQKSCCCSIL